MRSDSSINPSAAMSSPQPYSSSELRSSSESATSVYVRFAGRAGEVKDCIDTSADLRSTSSSPDWFVSIWSRRQVNHTDLLYCKGQNGSKAVGFPKRSPIHLDDAEKPHLIPSIFIEVRHFPQLRRPVSEQHQPGCNATVPLRARHGGHQKRPRTGPHLGHRLVGQQHRNVFQSCRLSERRHEAVHHGVSAASGPFGVVVLVARPRASARVRMIEEGRHGIYNDQGSVVRGKGGGGAHEQRKQVGERGGK